MDEALCIQVQGKTDMELPNMERALMPRQPALGSVARAPVKLPSNAPLPEGVINSIHPQVQDMAKRTLAQEASVNAMPPAPVSPQSPATPVQEPLSQLLMAHLHSVWTASARVVEQVQHRHLNPRSVPGELAKTDVTYTPSKVKKIDAA